MTGSYQLDQGVFGSTITISSEGREVGQLTGSAWSQSKTGMLNDKKYLFEISGFFRQEATVISPDDRSIVGKIDFNSWHTKGQITIGDRTYQWSYKDIFNTKWEVMDGAIPVMQGKFSLSKGEVTSELADELLVLSGVFIANFYLQSMIAIFVLLFIVMI